MLVVVCCPQAAAEAAAAEAAAGKAAAAAAVAAEPDPGSETLSLAKSRMRKAVRWLPKWPSLGKAARDDPSWGDPARVREKFEGYWLGKSLRT